VAAAAVSAGPFGDLSGRAGIDQLGQVLVNARKGEVRQYITSMAQPGTPKALNETTAVIANLATKKGNAGFNLAGDVLGGMQGDGGSPAYASAYVINALDNPVNPVARTVAPGLFAYIVNSNPTAALNIVRLTVANNSLGGRQGAERLVTETYAQNPATAQRFLKIPDVAGLNLQLPAGITVSNQKT
jgi:hypothetical protein